MSKFTLETIGCQPVSLRIPKNIEQLARKYASEELGLKLQAYINMLIVKDLVAHNKLNNLEEN